MYDRSGSSPSKGDRDLGPLWSSPGLHIAATVNTCTGLQQHRRGLHIAATVNTCTGLQQHRRGLHIAATVNTCTGLQQHRRGLRCPDTPAAVLEAGEGGGGRGAVGVGGKFCVWKSVVTIQILIVEFFVLCDSLESPNNLYLDYKGWPGDIHPSYSF